MYSKFILSTCFILLLISCKKDNSKNEISKYRDKLTSKQGLRIAKNNSLFYDSIKHPEKIIVPELPGDVLKYSTIIEDVRFIPLETKNESLFGSINELIVTDDLFFILDKALKKVLCFDIDGKFKFLIHNLGKGPKEFIEVSDIFVDSTDKNLFLLDSDQNKILKYDFEGNFLKETIIDFVYPFRSFSVNNGNYLIDFNNRVIPGMFPELEFDLITLDSLGKVKSRNLAYNKVYNPYMYDHTTCFSNNSDGLQYISLLKKSIYTISGNTIQKKYLLDFGKDNISEKDLLEFKNIEISDPNDLKKIAKKLSDKISSFSNGPINFLESETHIVFSYVNNRSLLRAIYDKTSKRTITDAQAVYDHKLGSILRFSLPISVNENNFYGVVYPNTIITYNKKLIESLSKKNIEEFYNKNPEYYSLIQKFEKDENANPHLVIMNFKEF